MQKIKYEIDPWNRLIAKKSGKKSRLSKFRQVLDGRFKAADGGTLTYLVKAPVSGGVDAPHQVKLKGKWSFSKGHDLVFTLNKSKYQASADKLTLQAEILDLNKNSLFFSVTTKAESGVQSIYTLNLKGSWQTDKNNRLTFKVKRDQDEYGALTFDGIWEIGENHQLIYQYEKKQSGQGLKQAQTLTFKGHWDIKDKARISYVMDADTNSAFDFKASLGVFRDKYIKYELGVKLSGKTRPIKRTITLFGEWKIRKGLGLVFEVERENKKVDAISFGANAKLTDKDTVAFKLKNKLNRGIGAQLELSHKILKGDGQAFIRLLRSEKESRVYAGAAWRW